MKYIFKIITLVALYASSLCAKEIILVTYHPSQKEMTEMIKKVIHVKMNFPKQLVEFYENNNPCEKKEVLAAHICLKENGEMDFPIIYTKTMKDTLGVFWKELESEIKER